MASISFEGRELSVQEGDTIASILQREGVTVLSRSFKYHRPRGLYCGTGDCPNCLLTVDGEPALRSCVTPARDGQLVSRANGWPSVDRDALSLIQWFKWALPVGFYYKAFTKPRALWPFVEKIVIRMAGLGPIDKTLTPASLERQNRHVELAVVGAGVAGLSAALAAAERGQSVVLVDEGVVGEKVAPGPTRDAIDRLVALVRTQSSIELIERAPVSGIYEGPLVTAASKHTLYLIHPQRVVVATGAVEQHAVFPGNDLPGVWLGRGAARMAGVHGVKPGTTAVVVSRTAESLHHVETLRRRGVTIRAVITPQDGEVVEAKGSRQVTAVVAESAGSRQTIACDTLVISLGFTPRDGLLRQAPPGIATGAGEMVMTGCSIDQAIASGRQAALHPAGEPALLQASFPPPPLKAGIICLCEDVDVTDLACAYREGFTSTEILKRYTTMTMGPCQGQMCQGHMRAFVRQQDPSVSWTSAVTTARPPARPITLEQAAAGYDHHIELRTALHDRHLEMGAKMAWAGAWQRPGDYGDRLKEYWAVRRGVSVMDVGTLGKFRVCGPDATEFLERLYPIHVATIAQGRTRYALSLNEAGYMFDDGLVGLMRPNDFFVTTTSSGADSAEAWFRDWNDAWKLKVRIVNYTAMMGAINVAGPNSRELLARLTNDPIDNAAIPYGGFKAISVHGIECLAIRVGFTGEMGFELHHPASRSVELWDALIEAGADLGIAPHGLETLKLLRLEKGHVIISQDTDFDTTPAKVGMSWVVRTKKPYFIGRSSLERLSAIPLIKKLVPIRFAGAIAPDEGAQLMVGDERVGYLTSCRYSPLLECGVALGWVMLNGDAVPEQVVAVSDNSRRRDVGQIAHGPFYDSEGARLRA